MRLLICGSRTWTAYRPIEQQIRLLSAELEVVIEGEARGADVIARNVAEAYDIPVLAFPANWKKYGRKAGIVRNRQMLEEGCPTDVVAFTNDFDNPRSGTRHMCRIAVEADIPTTLVEGGEGQCFSRDLSQEDFDD